MASIITGAAAKEIATPYSNIDVEYFNENIEYWQEYRLKPVLTKDLYDDLISNIGSFPAIQQTLVDTYIQYALSFGVAYLTIKKDVISQLTNQGVMNNRTDYSNNSPARVQMMLKEFAEREYTYLYDLGVYLLDNKADYTDFDWENTCLSLNMRDFLTL
jgi:hypothetical protein